MIVRGYHIERACPSSPIREELYTNATDARAWRLQKTRSGTRYGAHNWYRILNELLEGFGFVQYQTTGLQNT